MSRQAQSEARTVLVIEDDELFRASLCELLRNLGVNVQPVGDAQGAIRELKNREFDAVITDMDIPGSGVKVLRYAKLLRPATPVIILTGLPPSRVPSASAYRRLFKPATVGEIRQALSDAFDGNDAG